MPAGAPPTIRKISEKHDKVFVTGCLEPQTNGPRANAVLVVLARNQELDGVVQSIKSLERHFNRWFHYPYVFLNDGDFDANFRDTIMNYTSAPVEFGKIDPSMWGYPDWVNVDVAREGIRKQGDKVIMYGGMESYHHMCRFYSGFFYKHELLQKYDWYWRIEPEIKYFCDITYDPFIHMERANKTYGFTIAVKELKETVPNIFRYASAYMRNNNLSSQGLWEMFAEPASEEEKPKSLPTDDPKYKPPLPEEILKTQAGHRGLPDIDPEAMEGEKYNIGEMLRYTLLQRVLSSLRETSITSVTLDTDIQRFNIARLMLRGIDNYQDRNIWKQPPRTRRSERKRMNTGSNGILSRKMALAADADATQTLWTWRVSKVAVWRNGWQ
ncbi:hypothetical protein Q9189_005392 [Teloschistes chrysophthalmus]